MIELYRVDERVIHGQTTTRLTKEFPCDGVLVVEDAIAADPFMTNVYKNVLPESIRVHVYTAEKAATKLVEAQNSKKHYYVVFKRLPSVVQLLKYGYTIDQTLYVGPQTKRDNTKTFAKMCSYTDEEIQALDYIEAQGIRIIIDPMFETPNRTWADLKKENAK